MQYIKVLINKKIKELDRDFIYEVPAEWIGLVKIGSVVSVPFGHTTVKGIVVGFSDSPGAFQAKFIDGICNDDDSDNYYFLIGFNSNVPRFFKDEDYNSLIEPLREIVLNEEIGTIVLGLPKNMNNSLGTRAMITLEFKEMLVHELGINVVMEDERLTSVISNNVLISANVSRNKRKKKVDGMAAVIILQGYLDRMRKDN